VIKYDQAPIFANYVNEVIAQRRLAAGAATNIIKKLILNSLYGALGRDKSKEIDTYIVTNPYTDFKIMRRSNFKGFKIINSITSIV